jgi:hypothetical protein
VSVDLMNTVRLLHKVLGFLVQQPAEYLVDIAEGRRSLRLDDASADSQPPALPAEPPSVPAVTPTTPRQPTAASKATRPKATASRTPAVAHADADFAAVAADLKALDSVDDGLAFLEGLRIGGRKPTKADLQQIGAAMGLTVPKSATNPQAIRKLLDHAIGAKKKYAGLSKW